MNEFYNKTGIIDDPNNDTYGSVEGKIRSIASTFTDCEYMFANYTQANTRLDKIDKPTILYLLPPSGTLNFIELRRSVVDYPKTQIWFLCPSDFDFKSDENECRVEAMKRIGIKFIDAINQSGLFEPISGEIRYQIAYDTFDDNLTGVCLEPDLREVDGILLCDNTTYSRK